MRAILQQRQWMRSRTRNVNYGNTTLYFGCKHQNQDYIYQDDFEGYQKDGVLNHLYLAFSRDADSKVSVVLHGLFLTLIAHESC